MEVKNILVLIIFLILTFLISWFWEKKISKDKKERRHGVEKFFFLIFGMAATFIALDNWMNIRSIPGSDETKVINLGITSIEGLSWWAVYGFMTGIFLGIILLFRLYNRIMQNIKRFNIISIYHFYRMRYPGIKNFITLIALLSTMVYIPLIFYQIKVISLYYFPALNQYLGIGIVSLSFILIFLYTSNKDYKLPYLIFFSLFLIWFVLGFVNNQEQAKEVFYSKPDLKVFGTLIFLGLCYYISLPRNFSTYTNRKIDTLKMTVLGKSLFLGSLIFLLILFYLLPIGGWTLKSDVSSGLFLLILSFSVALPQLFVIKTAAYEGFKKYTLFSRTKATIISSFLFTGFILLGNFLSNSVDPLRFNYSNLYLISLTYVPILFPSFIGGFLFKRAKTKSFLLSYFAGVIVWFYFNITDPMLGFVLDLGFEIPVNLVTQTFFPFIVSLVFYLIPMLFSKKESMMAMGLTDPEELVIESFMIDTKNERMKSILSGADILNMFIVFFDNRAKSFNIDFLTYRTKIAKSRIVAILEILEQNDWIIRKNGFYQYKPQGEELENNLAKLVASYNTINTIFRKKVEEDFEEYRKGILKKAQELDTQISTISLLNEVSEQFSKIFKFETLYRKVAELCVQNLEFEGAEIFLVHTDKKEKTHTYEPVSMFYSNFQHLIFSLELYKEKVDKDSARLELFEQVLTDKVLIVNNPQDLEKIKSLPESYSSLVLIAIYQENEPFAIIQTGYTTEDKIIGTQDKQKIDFLINNLSQNIIIISLYESLEEKINQRTAELQKTNESLVQFNESLNHLNKEIKREMVAASAIQQAMFPTDFPYTDQIEIGVILKAMPDLTLSEDERKRIQISGDYYDVFDIGEGKVGVIIADVTGHGIPSALITTMSKISFYTHSFQGGTTAEICDRVNKDIFEALGVGDTGFYVTVFFLIYDANTGKLEFTNAGHDRAILIKKGSKKKEELDTQGFFIGSFDGAIYESSEIYLQEGDKFVLYTDGIIELRNPEGEFYEDKFFEKVMEYSEKNPKEAVQALFEDIETFRNNAEIKDDRTILIFEAKKIKDPQKKNEKIEEKTESNQDKIEEIKARYQNLLKKFKVKEFDQEMENEIEDLIPKIKDPYLLHYIKGFILVKKELFEDALKALKESEAINPDYAETLNYLAFVHFKLKNYLEAKQYWEKVLELKEDSEAVKKNLEIVSKLI